MDTVNIILKLIGLIVIAIGIICVYDARKLSTKFFGTADTNVATRNVKILGFVVSLIGSAIAIFG